MATVCLDKQVFYKPPMATSPSPTSHRLLVRKRGLSSTDIFAPPFFPPPPPLQQDTHDSRHGDPGNSEDTAILIPGDSESDDDFDDGRSDTPFASLEELVAVASKELKASGVAGAAGRRSGRWRGFAAKNRRNDGGWELLVKWKDGEETWEPSENVAETEALDEYETFMGR
ncbi:hypothetical protein VTI28DRAFT_9680 [Corynascus sepedonium]